MALTRTKLTRTKLTWYAYLLSGFFTFILNIQGNIIPFLRDELALSYRAVSLHPSAIAAGMICAGIITERTLDLLGRRRAFQAAVAGTIAGMLLLCVAPSAVVSVSACALVGVCGGMLPGIIAGFLAQLHPAAREQAFAECAAVTYGFVIVANLTAGASVALGLGWRAAVLLGAASGVLIVFGFGRGKIPDSPPRAVRTTAKLPVAYWAYWLMLGLGVALEYSVLLWCAAFLEQVVELSRAQAAYATAAFSAAMLLGRWGGSVLVRLIRPAILYPASLLLVVPGFALYWGIATPVASVVGLFVLGLSISLLYPLAMGFAVGVAGANGDAAGARTAFAAGTALLAAPLALGWLADLAGLAQALLVIPALAAAILLCFAVARALERRGVVAALAPLA